MAEPTACPQCKELTEAAHVATQRHIDLLLRLQAAIMNRDGNLIEALEFMAEEAGHVRQQITESFRHHLRSHRSQGGASAGSVA